MKKKLAACLLSATILFSSVSTAFAAVPANAEPQEPAKSVDFTHVKITDDFGQPAKSSSLQGYPHRIANVEKATGGSPISSMPPRCTAGKNTMRSKARFMWIRTSIRCWNPCAMPCKSTPWGTRRSSTGSSISATSWKNGSPITWTHRRKTDILIRISSWEPMEIRPSGGTSIFMSSIAQAISMKRP